MAGIGLLGSALAPGLQAIDTELTWRSAAFAVIVLVATVAVTVPRRWHRLLVVIAGVVTAQVAWLAILADHAAGAGTVGVVAALVLALLATGIWLQLASGTNDLDALATPFTLSATGLALLLIPLLYESDRDLGFTLLAAAGCVGGRLGGTSPASAGARPRARRRLARPGRRRLGESAVRYRVSRSRGRRSRSSSRCSRCGSATRACS